MRIITDYGEIVISLFGETPDTKKNFETLIDNGFYRDLTLIKGMGIIDKIKQGDKFSIVKN